MVRSLMYLMISLCSNIGFAIVKLAQQMVNSLIIEQDCTFVGICLILASIG